MCPTSAAVSGNSFTNDAYSGATMNSMKFICEDAAFVELESIIGEIGTPRARSMSPWLKNSPKTLCAHFSYVLNGFTAFEMSAACRMTFRMNCRSSGLS